MLSSSRGSSYHELAESHTFPTIQDDLGSQRGVPVFPNWFITEAAERCGDLPRRTLIGNFELASRLAGRRRPLARARRQRHDAPPLGVMDPLLAGPGVAARFGVAARAHQRDAE